MNVAMIPIRSQTLGRLVGGKGNRRLPLPVLTLPPDIGKFGIADLLGNGAERCASTDRL